MANEAKINILLSLKDEFSKGFKQVGGNLENTAKSFKKVGTAITGVGVAGVVAIKGWVDAANTQIAAETRLESIAKQVVGATEKEIQSMKDYASALQGVGVVGDEILIQGQSQLASFGLTSDQINTLSGSFGDLLVAEKGLNVTLQDSQTKANALGKAVATGLLGPLELSGVLLTEQQKALFKVADQEERVILLNEVLQQNYGGLNEAMRQTSAGGMKALSDSFGDFKEELGRAVLPILDKFVRGIQRLVDWFTNLSPKTKQIIALVTLFATGLALVIGPLLLLIGFLPAIIAGFGILAGVFTTITAAVSAFAAPIAIAIAAIVALKFAWENNLFGIQERLAAFREWMSVTFEEMFGAVVETVEKFVEDWQAVWLVYEEEIRVGVEIVKGIFSAAWDVISLGFTVFWEGMMLILSPFIELFKGMFIAGMAIIRGDWAAAWEAIKGIFTGVWEAIVTALTAIWEKLKEVTGEGMKIIADKIIEWLESVGEFFVEGWGSITEFFTGVWEGFKSMIEGGISFMIDLITSGFEAIKKLFRLAWDTMTGMVSGAWTAIKTFVSGGIDGIISIFTGSVSAVGNAFASIWNAASEKLTGFIGDIKSGIKGMVNWIVSKLNALIGKMNGMITGGINKLPGVELSAIPLIPALAKGGVVNKPTLAMIGEAGPEAVIPLNKAGLGGMGGMTVIVTNNTLLDEDAGEILGNAIIREVGDNQRF